MKKEILLTFFSTILLLGILPINTSFAQESSIPSWIKNNADWWSQKLISDDDFLLGIEYLVEKNVIKVKSTTSETSTSEEIPDWIRNNAEWWSQGLISDDDFVNGIEFLIKKNLINVKVVNQYLANTKLPLMLPILNIEDPDSELKILKKFLKPGDIFVFPFKLYEKATQIQKEIPGLELGTGGISIDSLLPGVSRLPGNVKYLTYDYEPDFTPEWTDDQTKSIEFFSKLHAETKKHNKKLVIVPVYHYGQDWDWGEVAKHTDVLVVQVQNYQRGGNFPPQYIPDESLSHITEKMIKQIEEKSPDTKLYLQIGFAFGSQPDELLQDINDVTELGIDGFTLWYNPGTSGKTSKFNLMQEALENLNRD